MKTSILIGSALLFSVSAFAQSPGANKQRKNTHGTEVSTVAKSEIEAVKKGENVSATASAKSQASVHAGENNPDARAQRKAERESERNARKQEQDDFVANIKAGAEARKQDGSNASADIKAEVESRKELLKQTREEAKDARNTAKAERKAAGDNLLDADAKLKIGKDDKNAAKSTRPAKVKGGAKLGTDVQISRPKVGARVRGTAGLGIL